MDALTPLLVNFLEEYGRPCVQEKVVEEIDETKVDLKRDMPDTVRTYMTGQDSNPLVAQVVSSMGDSFVEKLRSITNVVIDTASEGMDVLLTNGVMDTAKKVLTKDSGNGGLDLDFVKRGKEGMVDTTMTASRPVIKQVSDNISRKISTHLPKALGDSIQEFIDEHGFAGNLVGKAAGFMAKFMDNSDDTSDRSERSGSSSGSSIHDILQRMLGPRVMDMIKPYMDKFEEKMSTKLEDALRNKVFSIEYIKQKALGLLTGFASGASGAGGSGFGNIIGSFLNKGDDKDNDGASSTSDLIGGLASSFLKKREG